MGWEVEYTDEFGEWWEVLDEEEQDSIAVIVKVLGSRGPALPHPYSSGIESSRFKHMRELRIQHKGRPYRILYAFDPRRVAILLIGGCKIGDERWYETYVPKADDLYEDHLWSLKQEGRNDG